MNQRDEPRRGELEHGRESNSGEFERDHYQQGQRHRSVTNEWEAARGYGGGVDDLYGGRQGRYGSEGRYSGEGRHAPEAGASQPNYGSRGYWRDRPSWRQDPYGFGQRSQSWHEPFQNRRELFGRREDPHYYGTGSVGWGGPGYTGGAYAFGEGTRYEHRPLEGEYSDESTVSYGDQVRRQVRRYPPGPKGYKRSDERLKEDVSERLFEAYHIDSSEVTVEVQGAKVTLEGTVPSRHMKHAIEDLVDNCPGVADIDNRIRVASPNYQGSNLSPKEREVETHLPRH